MIAAREKDPKRQKKILWRYIHLSVVDTLKTDCLIIESDNMTYGERKYKSIQV